MTAAILARKALRVLYVGKSIILIAWGIVHT